MLWQKDKVINRNWYGNSESIDMIKCYIETLETLQKEKPGNHYLKSGNWCH